jgi:hypothetical protein
MTKHIEISDELYSKLMGIVKEVATQDNRATRAPYFFQIRDWKKVYDFNLNGDVHFFLDRDSGDEFETLEDLKGHLEYQDFEYDEDELKSLWEDWKNYGMSDLADWLEEKDLGLEACSYSLEPDYKNSFLTEKDAEDHLRLNHYHYHKDADTYLMHAWRNNDMETLYELFKELKPESLEGKENTKE